MYDNATVSLGQDFVELTETHGCIVVHGPMGDRCIGNRVMPTDLSLLFAAIPSSFVGNTSMQTGTYNISSYDWAGFLVARLYEINIAPN
jgi:hypothetical protein